MSRTIRKADRLTRSLPRGKVHKLTQKENREVNRLALAGYISTLPRTTSGRL